MVLNVLKAFSVPLRLTLHRSCSVCKTCVWPWKDERHTWPFPYPPADTQKEKHRYFKLTQQLYLQEKQDQIHPFICLCAGISGNVFTHFLVALPTGNLVQSIVCVYVLRPPADITPTMWKMMVSSLLVISTVMADLLCAMVPMSFHLSHTWKHTQINAQQDWIFPH